METKKGVNILDGKGGKFLFVRCPELKVSVVSAWFFAGSCFDPVGKEGLAHFFEHLLLQKTKRDTSRNARLQRLESMGIDFYAYTQKELAYFYHIQTPEKTADSLGLLVEGMTEFDFSEHDITHERSVISNEKIAYDGNINDKVWDFVFDGLFHGSSFEHNLFGNIESLKSITAKDIKAFYAKYYSLSEAVWVVLSPLDEESSLKDQLECLLAPYVKDNPEKSILPESSLGEIISHQNKSDGDSTTLLAIAFRTDSVSCQRKIVLADLLRSILASGWISLLNNKLRTEDSLIYWAKSAFDQFRDRGYVAFFLETQSDSLLSAETVALEQFEIVKDMSAMEKNIDAHKAVFSTRFLRAYHNPDDLLWWYGRQAVYGVPIVTPEAYIQDILSITPQELSEEAKKIFVDTRRTIIHLS